MSTELSVHRCQQIYIYSLFYVRLDKFFQLFGSAGWKWNTPAA